MTNMSEQQGMLMMDPVAEPIDPVDQLVPPSSGRVRLLLLFVAALVALTLAALAPMSGAVRPNIVFAGSGQASAGHGSGQWEYLLKNVGWTTASIESFDPGVPAVTGFETTFLANDGQPGPALAMPVSLAPQDTIRVRVNFTYDCAAVPSAAFDPRFREGAPFVAATPQPYGQNATVRARGLVPVTVGLDLGTDLHGGLSPMLSLLGFACEHVPPS
jgi:hypothetical protein